MNDIEHLGANRRDRDVIGNLVRKHINFVYATARRQVGGDAHLAEDVTQAVFILLLQKVNRIKSEAAMTSWLFTTTRYAAANAIKMARRRLYHEHAAAESASTEYMNNTEDDSELIPLLNDAIDKLPKVDRLCIIMSFLQDKSRAEVACCLGISEEAARKRVSRAVDRLRAFFESRGITAGAAGLTACLVRPAQVSAQLIDSTINIAILSQSAGTTATAASIAKGVTQMLFTTQLKLATAACITFAIAGAGMAQVIRHLVAPAVVEGNVALLQQAAVNDPSIVSVGEGAAVHFFGIGVGRARQAVWHSIDGKPIDRPTNQTMLMGVNANTRAYQTYVQVTGPQNVYAKVRILNALPGVGDSIDTDTPGKCDMVSVFQADPAAQTVDVEVSVANGIWKTFALVPKIPDEKEPWQGIRMSAGGSLPALPPGGPIVVRGGGTFVAKGAIVVPANPGKQSGIRGVTFSPVVEKQGKSYFYVSVEDMHDQWRVICTDVLGQEYACMPRGMEGAGKIVMAEVSFDLLPVQINSLAVQTRTFNKRVVARGITLDPSKPTKPQITVEDIPAVAP